MIVQLFQNIFWGEKKGALYDKKKIATFFLFFFALAVAFQSLKSVILKLEPSSVQCKKNGSL